MGNSQTKESRDPSSQGSHGERATGGQVYSSRNGNSRSSRHDLAFLGLGGSSTDRDAPEPRRETKQEREARKLEKERIAREKERERSMREEHVDGGYLVTQGVYTGTEDFSKTMVRQLMVSTVGVVHTEFANRHRSNGGWHLSGEVSKTSKRHGPNISWSPLREVCPYQRQTKYHQKKRSQNQRAGTSII